MPEWYSLIRAARYLHVPPWELAQQHAAWMNMALLAQAAEDEAEAELSKSKRR